MTDSAPGGSGAIELTTLRDGGQRPAEIARRLADFVAESRAEPRPRRVRRPLRDRRRWARARVAARRRPARRRRPPPLQRRPPRADPGAAPAGDRRPRRSSRCRSTRAGSPGSPTSCTTSTSCATATPSGRDRPTGRTTRGRGRRTSSSTVRLAEDRVRVHAHVRPALGERPGRAHGRAIRVPSDVDGAQVRAWFCPEHGEALSHRVAKHIGKAHERVRIASPVLTSGPILATLVEVVNEKPLRRRAGSSTTRRSTRCSTSGARTASASGRSRCFGAYSRARSSAARPRSPGRRTPLHDFMHAKVVVADDTDLRRQLQLLALGRAERRERARDPERGDRRRLAAYVDELRERYPRGDGTGRSPDASAVGRHARPTTPIARSVRMLTDTSQIAQGTATSRCLTSRDRRNASFVQGRFDVRALVPDRRRPES